MVTKKEMERIKRDRARERKKRREAEHYKWEREEERLEEESMAGNMFVSVFMLSSFALIALHNLFKWGHI